MKRVLITAGQVYGRLDDNKLVGNRSRGIWAMKFAEYLAEFDWRDDATEDFRVTLLVPDTMSQKFIDLYIGRLGNKNVQVVHHTGFDDYREKCQKFAKTHDAAVMAAAVVNWIPTEPIKGKMETKGFEVGDRIDISFYLAPRVINEMRVINPKLTLIGCKMLVGSERWQLLGASEKVIEASKAHVVVANDLTGLKTKLLVYPDRRVAEHDVRDEEFYDEMRAVITDEHWRTEATPATTAEAIASAAAMGATRVTEVFDLIVDKYRSRFYSGGGEKALGSVLLPIGPGQGYLASPRTKNGNFTSADAVYVAPRPDFKTRTIKVGKGDKATMNAPLLVRMAEHYMEAQGESCFAPALAVAVLHLHEQLEGVPTVDYAPPGTTRDCSRPIPALAFNIEGHGFVAFLDHNLEIMLP